MQFLSFSGREDEDVTAFLQNVNRVAFVEGKTREDDWIADYVGTCVTGIALDWYDELEEDVKRSWKDLRRALLRRFTARVASLVPEPPAARAPPSARITQPPPRNPSAARMKSFSETLRAGLESPTYSSKDFAQARAPAIRSDPERPVDSLVQVPPPPPSQRRKLDPNTLFQSGRNEQKKAIDASRPRSSMLLPSPPPQQQWGGAVNPEPEDQRSPPQGQYGWSLGPYQSYGYMAPQDQWGYPMQHHMYLPPHQQLPSPQPLALPQKDSLLPESSTSSPPQTDLDHIRDS
ncbi:hypothetical protein FRB95_007405 [Tulasnella sp. JGI-2019a]|nr:hypothetical protein FRB95_007405 [Tulasnella sp. JGI-2019a]